MASDATIQKFYYPLARLIVGPLLFLLGTFRAVGQNRFPPTGGVLVLANHISDLDPPVVMYAAKRPIRFMSKSELFEMKIIGPLLKAFKAFPVKRGEADRGSIRHAVEALKAGDPVGIFPEGQLSEDGKLQELKPGVALIIRMADCPVICCGLQNTDKPLPYGSLRPRLGFTKMIANWGEVKRFSKDDTNETIMAWVRQELLTLTGQDAGNGKR